jgi:hypothetical protein
VPDPIDGRTMGPHCPSCSTQTSRTTLGVCGNPGGYITVLTKIGGLELNNSARDETRIHREAGFALPSVRKWSSLPSPLLGKVGRW